MASCFWSCGDGRYYCSTMEDCVHRAQINRAPTWLIKLIRAWAISVGAPNASYSIAEADINDLPEVHKNPLRERFSHVVE